MFLTVVRCLDVQKEQFEGQKDRYIGSLRVRGICPYDSDSLIPGSDSLDINKEQPGKCPGCSLNE